MKLTLITATYNSAQELETCMASVALQDYNNIEHILVDGGSTDTTVALIKKYKQTRENIKWVSEPDQGIYDALNKGLAMATGDVIGFIHSDDILADGKIISKIMEQFKKNAVDGVYGDLRYVQKANVNKTVRVWKSCDFRPGLLSQGWMPAHPTFFLKKAVYEKHGNFDVSYRIAADYDFMLRVLQDGNLSFLYLPQVITKMRVGGASNRSVKNIIQKSKEDYKAMKSNGLPLPLWVLLAKNISKIPQFLLTKRE